MHCGHLRSFENSVAKRRIATLRSSTVPSIQLCARATNIDTKDAYHSYEKRPYGQSYTVHPRDASARSRAQEVPCFVVERRANERKRYIRDASDVTLSNTVRGSEPRRCQVRTT